MSRSSTSIELEPYAASTPLPHPTNIPVKNKNAPPSTDDLQPFADPPPNAVRTEQTSPTKGTTTIVLVTVVCVTMISTLLAGLVTVGLPTMAVDLNIPPSLLLW